MISWTPRDVPLAPTAVAARGADARALVATLLARDLSELRGVAEPSGGRDVVLVLGPEDALPWVRGAIYLGVDPSAPSLLLPTTEAPPWPAAVFERAVHRKATGRLVAVLPSPDLFVPFAHARPIERAWLEDWLG